MKNITKNLLALMLCLAVVFATVACNEEKKDEGVNGDPAKEATQAVENFAEAFFELDLDKAQEYVLNADGKWDGVDKDYVIEKLMKNMPEGLVDYKKDFEKVFEDMIDGCFEKMSIEVVGTEVKSDTEVVVEVKIKAPSGDAFKIDGRAIMQEIVVKLYNEGKISEDMSEAEIMQAIMPEAIVYFKNVFEDVDVTEKTRDITVVKKDGKWLLEAEGGLGDLTDKLDF